MRAAVAQYYKDFQLSVTQGQLRGITIYVVGQARQPGAYNLSGASTLVSALFASGRAHMVGTSGAITSLADKGLLRREPKPSDRREVHVFLTDEGRRLYGAIYPRVAAINRELVSGLSPAQRVQLDAMVDALQAQAGRMVAASPGAPLPQDGGE